MTTVANFVPDPDKRGMTTVLSHALTIAITGILLMGLLAGATSYFETEQKQVAEEQLRTIGNRLASNLIQVSQLDTSTGSATMRSNHADRVAGMQYNAQVMTGTDCPTGNTCLNLWTSELDAEINVPVHNKSDVTIERVDDGTFRMQALSSGGSTTHAKGRVSDLDLSSQVGVGSGVQTIATYSLTEPGNQPPAAVLTFDPGMPHAGAAIEFNASGSRDPDGTIQEYRWDFDDDGAFERVTAGPTTSETLSGGVHNVTVEVWDGAATANVTRSVDVSGLTYLGDLDTYAGDDTATATFRNDYSTPIELQQFYLNPADDLISDLDERTANHEIEIETSDGYSTFVEWGYGLGISDGGEFVDLSTGGDDRGGYETLNPGETVSVELHYFSRSVADEEMEVGYRYTLGGAPNSTVVTDTVGGSNINNYQVVASGQDVDVQFESTLSLTDIEAQVSGEITKTLDETDFTKSGTGPYTYEADVSTGSDGTFTVELTTAEASGTPSGETPLTDTVVVGGAYTWTSSSDWDAATVMDGSVVHANFGDHADDEVEVGYTRGGTGLVGYWPLDDPSNAPDVSGNGNDGMVSGDPTSTTGIGGSTAYSLDGSGDYVQIPDSSSLDMEDTDEVTVSLWVNKQATQSGEWIALFQHSDVSYNLHFNDGNEPYFTVYNPDDASFPDAQGGSIGTNQWYHIVGTFNADKATGGPDDKQIELYVDENNVAEQCQSGTGPNCDPGEIAPTNKPAGIGENIHKPGRHLNGKIDEVRVYDEELNPVEVEALHDVYTEPSTFETAFKSGPTLSHSSLKLQYDVSKAAGQEIEVRVITEGGEMSDWVTVPDGTGEVAVNGITSDADKYKLRVRLDPDSATMSPTVEKLGVTS